MEEEPKPVVEEEKASCGGGAKASCGGGAKASCGGGAKASCGGGVKASCGGGAGPDIKQASLSNESTDRILISPLARKLATEKGIDIKLVKGSGDNGRIIKRDIDSHKPTNYSQFIQPRPSITESSNESQNSTMRKAIVKRLSDSKPAPHYYLNIECEMDNMISFRKQFVNTQNIKISFNDIIAKAVSLSLARHPKVNSRWYDEKIVFYDHVHLGVGCC